MAAEIGLGATSLDEPEKSNNAHTAASPTSHEEDKDSASTLRGHPAPSKDELPIIYHYLTFETELPDIPLWTEHEPLRPSPPPCPNLRHFDNPFQWSNTRKSFMTWLSCLITVSAAYSSGSYIATADQLTQKWGISNVAYNTGITIFTVGFGIAPMALAPLSEEYGRRPVFLVSGLLYVVCQLCCALTESFGGMLAARFFLGVGGSVFSTMVGGILADIYVAADRNTPMVIFVGMTLFGTGLGPLVSDFVAQNALWRWVYYIQTITCSLLITAVALFFKETRGSILLSRKARALNKWYDALEAAGYVGLETPHPEPTNTNFSEKSKPLERIRWKVKSDEDRASLAKMIKVSLTRPFFMLFTESVVFWFSLWVSFSWAILYLTFGAIPLVFRASHAFSLQQTGLAFTAVMAGGVLSTILSIYQEKLALAYFPHKVSATPEGRLYFACVESALMPIGLFWFGWTSSPGVHWIVPAIAIAVATMGIFSIYLATFNYLADIYHRYASSAIAAQSMCRNLLGGAFPLVTVQMYNSRLGFAGASSLLGGLALALTAVPWVLILYGPRIRARSPFAREIMLDL